MSIRYSKPVRDVMGECRELLETNEERLERQCRVSSVLGGQASREECVLCGEVLSGLQVFEHRDVEYISCGTCGQVQTYKRLPVGYPFSFDGQTGFQSVYPCLAPEKYASRTERIYLPKLEWALDCLEEFGEPRSEVLARSWLELGAGQGHFLQALRNVGASAMHGLEENQSLVDLGNEALGQEILQVHDGSLAEAVEASSAQVFVSFFVLEHLTDVGRLLDALQSKPSGTIFIFAVPIYGLAAALEGCCDKHFARSLDSVVHSQMFTERSIQYCLDRANMEEAGRWVFGQDAMDVWRILAVSLKDRLPAQLYAPLESNLLTSLDELQSVLDRHHLADACHVVGVRR